MNWQKRCPFFLGHMRCHALCLEDESLLLLCEGEPAAPGSSLVGTYDKGETGGQRREAEKEQLPDGIICPKLA